MSSHDDDILENTFIKVIMWSHFYPRPVLAFRYCRYLHLSVCLSVRLYECVCVCLCVHQPRPCPHDNSSRVEARTTKFGQKMQNNLLMVPIVLGSDWPWPSRSNLTSKSKFTPFWACEFVRTISHHWLKSGFPNLDQKCIFALLILGLIGLEFQSFNKNNAELFGCLIGLYRCCKEGIMDFFCVCGGGGGGGGGG